MLNLSRKPSRLDRWNGRSRSTRGETLTFQPVWRKPVLQRLGLALLTAVVVALLVFAWGPRLPYRVGEICPTDLRVRAYFEVIDQTQTEWKREEAVERVLTAEKNEPLDSNEIRQSIPPVINRYLPGMPLVLRGKPITERNMSLLEEEHRAYLRTLRRSDHARRGLGLLLIMTLLAAVLVLYVARFQPALACSLPKIGAIAALAVVTLALALLLSRPPWYAALVPLTITAMILTIVYNPQFALLMSLSLALAATVALGTGFPSLLIQLGGLATAILLLYHVDTRTRLVKVAGGAGLAYLAMTVAAGLLSGQTWSLIGFDAGRNCLWGTLAGFVLTGSLPLVEHGFGVVTDISLLELADCSHPLLQELIQRAPGTYTHSMTVATLAESAAETIGANPLLARVGSYFHDVGKMLKPRYFIENQLGENRHDSLEPALSTLVILNHIKDGVALAKQYGLPRPIVEVIQEHHGTTLVEYFYHEALRLRPDHADPSRLETTFRYPGPKPRTREAAVIMLADAVEGASRSMHDPAPGSLGKLVHELLMKRLLDGQFEECGLTLSDLHQVEESLTKGLIALHHARIKYPEKKKDLAS